MELDFTVILRSWVVVTQTLLLCASGLEGGRGRLPVWGDAPDRRHCRNDTQLLWLKPLQPEQRGFTPCHLPAAVLVPCSDGPQPRSVSPEASETGSGPLLPSGQRESCQTHMDWNLLMTPPLITHIEYYTIYYIIQKSHGIIGLHGLIQTFSWLISVQDMSTHVNTVLMRCPSLNSVVERDPQL